MSSAIDAKAKIAELCNRLGVPGAIAAQSAADLERIQVGLRLQRGLPVHCTTPDGALVAVQLGLYEAVPNGPEQDAVVGRAHPSHHAHAHGAFLIELQAVPIDVVKNLLSLANH